MVKAASSTIDGGPTKRFFVSMLPKDIDLSDAILDLVDNSIDGAMRLLNAAGNQGEGFTGYRCRIYLSEQEFRIEDNCGGIPPEDVEDAFRLGRPSIAKDGDLPTIGMYGIGMKRSIFKMAKSASVQSITDGKRTSVEYTPKWLDPDNDDFRLELERGEEKVRKDGVYIRVNELKKDIARQFANSAFIDALADDISEHFAYLMMKGFEILINDRELKPRTVQIIDGGEVEGAIRPYAFFAEVEGVAIRVIIGLFRRLTSEEELEAATEGADTVERAGISVICNDRVVLLSDRTSKTGWGLGSAPRYHPQFRAISGVIEFTATNAEKLPISTTKRGLDTDSEIYLVARNAAVDGIKTFTAFTNKWKGKERETDVLFDAGARVEAARFDLAQKSGVPTRGVGAGGAKRFTPDLPKPQRDQKTRRIAFSRDVADIETVSVHLFGRSSVSPSDVGAECFDWILKSAKK